MAPEVATILKALALYAAAVLSPGPSFALITRLSASGARSAALGATVGFSIIASIYAILSMAGLSVVITRVGWLMTTIQIAGGCYLIYLGLSAWLAGPASEDENSLGRNTVTAWRGFRMGVVVELSNVKGIAFFVSLFAVAIPAGTPLWAKATILAGSFSLELVWYGIAAMLLTTGPARAVYARFGIWIERAIGTVLAGFGFRLITETLSRRP